MEKLQVNIQISASVYVKDYAEYQDIICKIEENDLGFVRDCVNDRSNIIIEVK